MKKESLLVRLLRLIGFIKPKRFNKETYNKYQREYREKNRDKFREYAKKRYTQRKMLKMSK